MDQNIARDAILLGARPGLEQIVERMEFVALTHCWCGALLQPWLPEFKPYNICPACQCKAVAYRPTVDSLRTFYEQNYWYEYQTIHNCPSIEERYENDFHDRVGVYSGWINQLRNPPARLLEIGSGNGRLLHELCKMGYDGYGTDMDPRVAKWITDKTGVPIASGPLPPPEAGSFDIILALDVIEHVPDPVAFAGNLSRLLRPEGSVMIHCPIINNTDDAHRLRHMFNVLSHLWMHNDDSLARLWARFGMKPRRMGELFGTDCFGFVPAL